jgi:hypothetical protein
MVNTNFKLRVLNPLKGKAYSNFNMLGFDTETLQNPKIDYPLITEQSFLLGCVYGEEIQRYFWDRQEMEDFLLSDKFSRNNYKIYASNLDFDFRMIFQDSKALKNFFQIEKNGLIYAQYKPNLEGIERISFYDTWNYTGKVKVEELGKLLNIEKLEKPSFLGQRPKTWSESEELKAYCMRDAQITYHTAKFMQTFTNSLNCKLKITLASTGMDYWRRNHQKEGLFQESREILQKHFLAFHGGRVEMFKRGVFDYPIYIFDYNSHYPACCYYGIDNKGSYPNPNSGHYLKKGHSVYIDNYEGISKIKIKIPYKYALPLGINSVDGKLIFPYGIIEGFFTHIEIRKALEIGSEILEYGECIYYSETFKPFRECIKVLYKLRSDYREKNDLLMSQMVKTLMNSGIFGKFAQKIDEKSVVHFDENIFSNEHGELFHVKDGKEIILNKHVVRGHIVYEKVPNPKIPLFVNPILASYTTALARLKLYDNISKYEKDLVYCDTDSLMLTKRHFEDSKELGGLKLECIMENSIFGMPKLYGYEYYKDGKYLYRIKSKGLPKDIETKEDFMRILSDGKIDRYRWLRNKEANIRGEKFASIVPFTKKIGLNDTKRAWPKSFSFKENQDSSPIYIK